MRLIWLAISAAVGFTLPALAQDATLTHTDVSGGQASLVDANVTLDSTFDVAGWSYSICTDISLMFVIGAAPGATTATVNGGGPPDFQDLTINSTSISDGVVISFLGVASLPPGSDYELLDITYELLGSPGEIGQVCFCDLGGSSTVSPTGAAPIAPTEVCGWVSMDPCTAIVPNRGIENFEILPRFDEPGAFDLVVDWVIETASPDIDLSTNVVFEVDGVVVGSVPVMATVGSVTCCSNPGCLGTTCGPWAVDGLSLSGACEESVAQGACACRVHLSAQLLDVDIAEGQPVTARLEPSAGSIPENSTADDTVTRLAPFFNRELVRVAWVPDVQSPGQYRLFAYFRLSAFELDSPADLSLDFTVNGPGPIPAMTEHEIKIPGGVDKCAEQECGYEPCFLTESGDERASCGVENQVDCPECTAADIVELQLTAAVQDGDEGTTFDITMGSGALALAEADPGDDAITVVFNGPVPAANRRVTGVTQTPSSTPGFVDLEVAWRVETGAEEVEVLTSEFLVSVNSTNIAIDTFSPLILGSSPTLCPTDPCTPTTCGAWTVDGIPATAQCAFSPIQQTCACGIDMVTTLEMIPASPGDVVEVTCTCAPGTTPDILTSDDTFSFTVGPNFIRGDANGDSDVDLADAVAILTYLFSLGFIPCRDAADVGDSGDLDIADAIALLSFLFQSSAPPSTPFPDCGSDPTPDALGCNASPGCP